MICIIYAIEFFFLKSTLNQPKNKNMNFLPLEDEKQFLEVLILTEKSIFRNIEKTNFFANLTGF